MMQTGGGGGRERGADRREWERGAGREAHHVCLARLPAGPSRAEPRRAWSILQVCVGPRPQTSCARRHHTGAPTPTQTPAPLTRETGQRSAAGSLNFRSDNTTLVILPSKGKNP